MRLISTNKKQKKMNINQIRCNHEYKALYSLLNTKQRSYLKEVIILLLRHRL